MGLKINPSDSGGWNGIRCGRKRGDGAIIEDIEAADAEMKVVMGEEFGEILRLIFHCDVRLVLC